MPHFWSIETVENPIYAVKRRELVSGSNLQLDRYKKKAMNSISSYLLSTAVKVRIFGGSLVGFQICFGFMEEAIKILSERWEDDSFPHLLNISSACRSNRVSSVQRSDKRKRTKKKKAEENWENSRHRRRSNSEGGKSPTTALSPHLDAIQGWIRKVHFHVSDAKYLFLFFSLFHYSVLLINQQGREGFFQAPCDFRGYISTFRFLRMSLVSLNVWHFNIPSVYDLLRFITKDHVSRLMWFFQDCKRFFKIHFDRFGVQVSILIIGECFKSREEITRHVLKFTSFFSLWDNEIKTGV